jgi:hypothetical protein
MPDAADRFLDRWHARVGDALVDALEFLAAQEESPFSDGVLSQWVRELCALRFEARHVGPVLALLEKRDPHLHEAGVRLAARAIELTDDVEAFESRVAALLRDPQLELWVLQAVVDLLRRFVGPRGPLFTEAYRALVSLPPPRGRRIMRNRFIAPQRDLDELYEQHALQTLRPTERDLLFLPVLEARYGTRGWRPTVVSILEKMGLDVAHHMKVLGDP